MQINLSWGNLNKEVYAEEVEKVLEKNLTKIKRILKEIDEAEINVEIRLNFNKSNKDFSAILFVKAPKLSYHIEEKGYTIEEAVNNSTANLRRQYIEEREKKIFASRNPKK